VAISDTAIPNPQHAKGKKTDIKHTNTKWMILFCVPLRLFVFFAALPVVFWE
jgi:hypothetical protein